MEPITPGSNPPPAIPPEAPMDDQQQGSPIDDMIAQVDSYIKNPSMVTPETLNQLKQGLMDLRDGVEGEPPTDDMGPPPPPEGSFSGDIHKRMSEGAY